MVRQALRSRDVDRFLARLEPRQRAVARALRTLLHQVGPDLREQIKWGVPCFIGKKLVCSIAPQSDHTNLEFYHGTALRDAGHLLEGTGKHLRHVKFHTEDEVRVARVRSLLMEAIAYDAR